MLFFDQNPYVGKTVENNSCGTSEKLPRSAETPHIETATRKGNNMELRELLGEELFSQVDAKIQEHNSGEPDKLKHVRYADLSEGNYVSREKYTTLQTESNGYKAQLEDANKEIKSYKDMDIEGIKQKAADWEQKYIADTAKLNKQLDDQKKSFAAERYLDSQKIKSPLAKKSILADFLAQDMKFRDDGTFEGAEEYMKKVREQYPDDFETESKPEDKPEKKTWVRGTQGTYKPGVTSSDEAYRKQKYGNNKYYKGNKGE